MSKAYEIATISVQEALTAEFRDGIAEGAAIIARQPGCSGVDVWQCLEEPGQFLLRVAWDDVEAHMTFRESEDFQAYRNTVAQTFVAPPTFKHYTQVLSV